MEKATFLFELFPHAIAPILNYVLEMGKKIQEDPGLLNENWQILLSKQQWADTIQATCNFITSDYSRILDSSKIFSGVLFVGNCGMFILACLQEYMNECEDDKLYKALELLFDL